MQSGSLRNQNPTKPNLGASQSKGGISKRSSNTPNEGHMPEGGKSFNLRWEIKQSLCLKETGSLALFDRVAIQVIVYNLSQRSHINQAIE